MTEARPRWFTDNPDTHSHTYVERFRTMAAEGSDLTGEARFVDTLLPRHARVLDAGCGPGRIGAALHDRGHDVTGVDVDPVLLAAAVADHPGPRWLAADLSRLDLPGERFDLAVLAGNVMVLLAPGTERQVLARVAAHVRPGGAIVTGFALDREYRLEHFDRDSSALGLRTEHRFAAWDLTPWHPDADWAVTVLRTPAA